MASRGTRGTDREVGSREALSRARREIVKSETAGSGADAELVDVGAGVHVESSG